MDSETLRLVDAILRMFLVYELSVVFGLGFLSICLLLVLKEIRNIRKLVETQRRG